jgi:hypothetical protein
MENWKEHMCFFKKILIPKCSMNILNIERNVFIQIYNPKVKKEEELIEVNSSKELLGIPSSGITIKKIIFLKSKPF